MITNNIVIVGITGVGKTTIGKYLADYVGKQFIDLDKHIELICGVDIPTIFELEGEEGFRNRETFALKSILHSSEDFVLSLGGGCVIRPENRQMIMRDSSFVVQLVASLDIIVDRLIKSPNKRPLLTNQDVKQKVENLFEARRFFYDSVSDATINTTNLKPIHVIEKIINLANHSK